MLFPEIPENFADLNDEDLAQFEAQMREALAKVAADPSAFTSDDLSAQDLLAAARDGADALRAAREEINTRADAAAVEVEDVADEDEPVALSDEETAELAALADEFSEVEDEAEGEGDADEDGEGDEDAAGEAAADEVVVASAKPRKPAARRPLPKPSRSRQVPERREEETRVPLVATAGAPGMDPGDRFPSMESIAEAMQRRRRQFGIIPEGTSGEKVPIAFADWRDTYPTERKLSGDELHNEGLVASIQDQGPIRRIFSERRDKSLTASGGLCAPVTPYYQLAMISMADRPVRAALPAFNADRGGIRYARPATLASITTGVGTKTAADDALGGTFAQKTCQVVDCPAFQETDVAILYHCLQFGNLGARTFPERVTQWTNLTLAAHSRLAESALLTGIDTASTQVTAASLGLGASASLFSEIMTAGAGMRSRHRMDPNAVLRVMLPWWAVWLIVSDVFRGQFQRFDVDKARVTALLRSIDIEPTFYIDGANGKAQVYGTQGAGALLPFPSTVVWYLYPEGSFLYIDGGTLELGLVRDSVLNKTNDFQIFGETFENVAFVGVESLAVTSTVCDSGTVSLPHAVACPIDYTHTS